MKQLLFQNISEEDYKMMLVCLRTVTHSYQEGEIIYSFQREKTDIGILEKGEAYLERIDMEGNQVVLDYLEEGSAFGSPLAFGSEISEDYSVVCSQKCVVTFFPYENVSKQCAHACQCHQQLIKNLMDIFASKAKEFGERIEVITNRTIRNKLLHYFQIQSYKQKNKTIEIPFSGGELSEYLCVDRSAMSRELGNLKREGIITMHKRKVTLKS